MSSQIINIICQGERFMPLSDLTGLQGELKTLSESDYQKLKNLILKDGFAFPLRFAFLKNKPYGIIDGHQTHKTVLRMISEGYPLQHNGQEVDYLPVSATFCRDKKHASRLILNACVKVGKITNKGWESFVEFNELDKEELRIDFQEFPDFIIKQEFDFFQSADIPDYHPQPPQPEHKPARHPEASKPEPQTTVPIAIILSFEQYDKWVKIKESLGYANDTKAFLELMERL